MNNTMDLFQPPPDPAEPDPMHGWECVARGSLRTYYEHRAGAYSYTLRYDTQLGTWRASAGRAGGNNYHASVGEFSTPYEAMDELRMEIQRLEMGLPDDTGLDAVAAKHGGRR